MKSGHRELWLLAIQFEEVCGTFHLRGCPNSVKNRGFGRDFLLAACVNDSMLLLTLDSVVKSRSLSVISTHRLADTTDQTQDEPSGGLMLPGWCTCNQENPVSLTRGLLPPRRCAMLNWNDPFALSGLDHPWISCPKRGRLLHTSCRAYTAVSCSNGFEVWALLLSYACLR